ncbi:MAG: DUF4848 domain-containing protein [Bacteroidaceae bacterium]|nr:DUF4848 domain-containing protein [Bacteroidaceae bacterium]
MKNLFILLSVIFMTACTNSEPTTENVQEECDEVATVFVNGQLALSFSDETSLHNFKTYLRGLSLEQRKEAIEKLGIKNLHDLEKAADKELEHIGQAAQSEQEFSELYNTYLKKYEESLIKNEEDPSDLTLYCPDSENMDSYLVNEGCFYLVNGRIVKPNLRKSVPVYVNRRNVAKTRGIVGTNSAEYSPADGKKIYFDAYLVDIHMRVSMHARKKMWYGWKNDPNRQYFFDSFVGNVQYVGQGSYGQEAIVPRLPRYIFNQNVDNGFDIILCKLSSGNSITGYIDTWVDWTIEHDANGNDITEVIDGYTVPKCLKSKANTVNINLTPTAY